MKISPPFESTSFVLVTGTSTGIGRALVLDLARAGHRVLAGVRSPADADILAALHCGITPLQLDVTNPEHVQTLSARVESQVGAYGLGALINNAGVNYMCPFEYSDEARLRQLMEVNFMGLARVTQALIPLLRRHVGRTGHTAKIVNVGSIGSAIGVPWESFYHASKFAVLGFSESLRFELCRERIVVCCLMPGGVITEIFRKSMDDIKTAQAALPPDSPVHYRKGLSVIEGTADMIKKFGSKPEKIAGVVSRLLRREKPGLKHVVGIDAWILYTLSKVVPSGLRHTLLRSSFGA